MGIGKDRVWIGVGSNDGVEVGMQFQIKRKGEIIGTAEITKISEFSSEIKITSVAKGVEIDLGDKVENIIEEVKIAPQEEIKDMPRGEKKEKVVQDAPKETFKIPRTEEEKIPSEKIIASEKLSEKEKKIDTLLPKKREKKKIHKLYTGICDCRCRNDSTCWR